MNEDVFDVNSQDGASQISHSVTDICKPTSALSCASQGSSVYLKLEADVWLQGQKCKHQVKKLILKKSLLLWHILKQGKKNTKAKLKVNREAKEQCALSGLDTFGKSI